MGDTVSSEVLFSGGRIYEVVLYGKSDGTGESKVKKVDISTLEGTPGRVAIEYMRWAIEGTGFMVDLYFDRDTDQHVAQLTDTGVFSFSNPLNDDGSGGTGDVLLSSTAGIADAVYMIHLRLRLKQI